MRPRGKTRYERMTTVYSRSGMYTNTTTNGGSSGSTSVDMTSSYDAGYGETNNQAYEYSGVALPSVRSPPGASAHHPQHQQQMMYKSPERSTSYHPRRQQHNVSPTYQPTATTSYSSHNASNNSYTTVGLVGSSGYNENSTGSVGGTTYYNTEPTVMLSPERHHQHLSAENLHYENEFLVVTPGEPTPAGLQVWGCKQPTGYVHVTEGNQAVEFLDGSMNLPQVSN